MERRGSDKYPAAFLQKTFKELEAAGKTKAAGAGAEEEGVDEGEGVKEEDTAGTAGNGEGQA